MKLYNLQDHNQQVNFTQALQQGLGRRQGLFFPLLLPEFSATEIEALLQQDFVSRSTAILAAFIGDEIAPAALARRVQAAFNFPLSLLPVEKDIAALSLFQGPTLAFKDFGARFMAQMLAEVATDMPVTILTATSGDTGAAVAHAFHIAQETKIAQEAEITGVQITADATIAAEISPAPAKNVRVVVLYPRNKISRLQEQLFCTLGDNIHTIAIDGDFDACQALVKAAFDDAALRKKLQLNSANSINISRLLAQICYYFEAVAQLSLAARNQLVIAVPSGNFGNLTAGLLAKALGLPIKRFIAATNVNDTVPRFLRNGAWQPHPTVATLSNAMDVSQPNNWPRVMEIFRRKAWPLTALGYGVVDDATTARTLQALAKQGYLAEPHAAVAYRVLRDQLQEGEFGLFLATAHPAKFKESVEKILGTVIALPPALQARATLPLLSHTLPADYRLLREWLLERAS